MHPAWRQPGRRTELHADRPVQSNCYRPAQRYPQHHLRRSAAAGNGYAHVPLGSTATEAFSLEDDGTASLSGLRVQLVGDDSAAFHFAASCIGQDLPVGSTCQGQVTFAPTHIGAAAAARVLNSSDPAGPTQIQLTGMGAQAPGFTLSVSGAPASTLAISSGDQALFPLLLTPLGGYSAPVALTCTSKNPAPNALCSLSDASMSLGNGPVHGSATVATASGILASLAPLPWLLLPGMALGRRKAKTGAKSRVFILLLLLTGVGALLPVVGCGGGSSTRGAAYTSPGTYTYQVTAVATQGTVLTSTVTLTVVVH